MRKPLSTNPTSASSFNFAKAYQELQKLREAIQTEERGLASATAHMRGTRMMTSSLGAPKAILRRGHKSPRLAHR